MVVLAFVCFNHQLQLPKASLTWCLGAMQALQFLHCALSPRGTQVLCVLTQADVVDTAIEKDVAEVEKSLTVHQMRNCVTQKTGLPLNQVPLKLPSFTLVPHSLFCLCFYL